jgi:SEC-C motif-containing protein
MRSRYAAYALGLADYVLDTTVPEKLLGGDRALQLEAVLTFGKATSFFGLEVKGSGETGDAGWVSFRAILTQGSRDASFEERSQFVRRAGRWLYVPSGAVTR